MSNQIPCCNETKTHNRLILACIQKLICAYYSMFDTWRRPSKSAGWFASSANWYCLWTDNFTYLNDERLTSVVLIKPIWSQQMCCNNIIYKYAWQMWFMWSVFWQSTLDFKADLWNHPAVSQHSYFSLHEVKLCTFILH